MIPKIIHYCWFGRTPLPREVEDIINSWKKYCPDYEFKVWNEDNFEMYLYPYVREAYENGKYAFVTDVVRLYALYNEGGIYMDTDVEVIKSFDNFLHHNAFMGFEDDTHVSSAVIGCEKSNQWAKDNLDYYKDRHFIKEDGSFDLQTNVITITRNMVERGLRLDNSYQELGDFTVFPKDFFSPKDYYTEKIKLTKNTHAIHHFSRTWCENESRWQRFVRRHPKFNQFRLIPNKIAQYVLGKHYIVLKRLLKR